MTRRVQGLLALLQALKHGFGDVDVVRRVNRILQHDVVLAFLRDLFDHAGDVTWHGALVCLETMRVVVMMAISFGFVG